MGHAHLVMFGVFSMWLLGIMTYLFPKLWGREWWSQSLLEWHFWLSAVGLFSMFLDLVLVGIFQGFWWASMAPWETMTDGSQPFWIVRVFAGLAMFAGQCVFLWNIFATLFTHPETTSATA